jgi:lipopolysaccharide/colanic/teichoic acid biosynthesis glycosyltransferase
MSFRMTSRLESLPTRKTVWDQKLGNHQMKVPLYKHIVDLCGAVLVGAVVLLPALVAGIAIRATMGRGVIFKQTRAGLEGEPFTIYKFRTMMHADPNGSTVGADRITPVGRFLRRWSIDEIPQLFNVLNRTICTVRLSENG